MKEHTIRLVKAIIDNDIDHRTYKRMEVSLQNLSETSRDAAASDTDEVHDNVIVMRYRDHRDSRIRRRLMKYLKRENTPTETTNERRPESETEYVYQFVVPDDFDMGVFDFLADDLHEYIVRGTIYDWNKHSGLPTTDSETDLEELENSILNSLRGKPAATRPLQPFGPPFPKTPLF